MYVEQAKHLQNLLIGATKHHMGLWWLLFRIYSYKRKVPKDVCESKFQTPVEKINSSQTWFSLSVAGWEPGSDLVGSAFLGGGGGILLVLQHISQIFRALELIKVQCSHCHLSGSTRTWSVNEETIFIDNKFYKMPKNSLRNIKGKTYAGGWLAGTSDDEIIFLSNKLLRTRW